MRVPSQIRIINEDLETWRTVNQEGKRTFCSFDNHCKVDILKDKLNEIIDYLKEKEGGPK